MAALLCLIGCGPDARILKELKGPGGAKLGEVRAVMIAHGRRLGSGEASSDRAIVRELVECVRTGIAPDLEAEAARQSRRPVDGELVLVAYKGARRSMMWSIPFDSENLRTPRYARAFVDGITKVQSRGEPFVVVDLRMKGAPESAVRAYKKQITGG